MSIAYRTKMTAILIRIHPTESNAKPGKLLILQIIHLDFNFFNQRHLCKIAWIVVEIHGRFWIEYLWWNQVGSHTLQIYPTFQSYCNCNISNVIQDTNPRWLLHISNICVEQHIVRTAIIMVTIFHAPFKREAVAWMNILLLTLLPRNG